MSKHITQHQLAIYMSYFNQLLVNPPKLREYLEHINSNPAYFVDEYIGPHINETKKHFKEYFQEIMQ